MDTQPGIVGEPIVGTYWREQYLEAKRQRDEARAEVEHLKEIMVMATKPEEDWANLRAQTKEQLVREHYEMLEGSRRSTEAMNRAKAKIDELRAENQRLTRALCSIVEADPAWREYVSLVLSGKLAEAAEANSIGKSRS